MKILRLLTPARFLIGSVLMMLAFSPGAFAQTSPLTLAIKATPDPVQPGQAINYVFTCANSGTTAIDEVQVTYLQPNYTLGAFSQAPGYTQTATLYNLLPGQSQQVTSALKVFASDGSQGTPPPDGTVIEVNASAAALDSGGNPTGVSTSTTSDVIVAATPVFNLQMSSTDPDFVVPGANKTYTLRYSNPSTSSDAAPVLVATLPAGATYVSASNGGGLAADGTVQWAIAPLLPGDEGQRSFIFSVDGSTAAGTLLVTTASIQDGSATSRSARASSTNVVRTADGLSLAVKATPDPVQPGQVIDYVITCTNTGTTAVDEATVSYLQPNGTLGAYSQAPGFLQTAYLYNILPGQSQQVTSSLTVPAVGATQGTSPAAGTLLHLDVNAAALGSDGNPSGLSVSTTSDVSVAASPGFDLQMSPGDPDSVAPGATKTFVVSYGNPSATAGSGVTLAATLPAGTAFVSATGGGTLAADGVTVQWPLGTLAAGASGQYSFTFAVDASAEAGTLLVADAIIQDGSATSRSARTRATNVVSDTSGLTLSITATPDPVQPGQVIDYVITCTNASATEIGKAKVSYLQPNGTLGAYSQAPGFLQTAYLYNILPGQSQQVTSSLTVPAVGATQGTSPAAGTLLHLDVNAAALGSDGNPSGLSVSTTSDVAVVNPPPAFFTGEISLGSGVYYLAFSDGNFFGYYSFLTDPAYIYHFDLGYEYVFDAADGNAGVYFYDFASSTFFYTSPVFPFPYLYDFTLNSVLYYYPVPTDDNHYTSAPRYFYDFATGEIITK